MGQCGDRAHLWSSHHLVYLTCLQPLGFWSPPLHPGSTRVPSPAPRAPFLPRWAVSHRQRLLELNSSLEFKLHRLHFIRLLAGGPEKQLEALSYARHFQPFARLHQRGECSGGWALGCRAPVGVSVSRGQGLGCEFLPLLRSCNQDAFPQPENSEPSLTASQVNSPPAPRIPLCHTLPASSQARHTLHVPNQHSAHGAMCAPAPQP